MKKAVFVIILMMLLIASLPLYAQMSRLSLSERIEMSQYVFIVRVEKTYKGEGEDEAVGNWFAECEVKEVLTGSFDDDEEKITVNYKNIRRRKRNLTPIRLQEGSEYLLFLKRYGNAYQMISPFQGAFEKGKNYSIYDEGLKDRSRSVNASYDEILAYVRELLEG